MSAKTNILMLPPGTMVVARVAVPIIGGKETRAQGSTGRVVETPIDPTHAYRVAFVDGTEAMVKRDQIAVLKHFQNLDFDDGLEEYDLYQHVIFRVVVGSRAYGLEHAESDTDRRGIYMPPAEMHWSLYGVPDQLENLETEECYWEMQKFLVLALKANPNILECLYSPLVETQSDIATELLDRREMFLSKLIYQTYNRYVMSQFKKLNTRWERVGEIKWKHAMHLIRLLHSGITILEHGFVPVRVEGEVRAELVAIRDGEMPWEDVDKRRLALHTAIDAAYEKTALPDRPDYNAANAFLIHARKLMVA